MPEGWIPVWLTRAAAFVEARDGAHRAELMAYYRRGARDDYDTMGAHLLGLVDEDRLLEMAQTPERRCEIAFYVGLKAKSEGRLEDAVDWFRIVLEIGRTQEYEHIWAQHQLLRFASQGRSLTVQAAAMK